jgi:hypothetical protein
LLNSGEGEKKVLNLGQILGGVEQKFNFPMPISVPPINMPANTGISITFVK